MATFPNSRYRAFIWRALWLGLAWIVVAGPAPASWLIGAPSVVFATWASLRLTPSIPYKVDLAGLLGLVGYFLLESLRGGLDVAMRTLSPQLRVQPGHVRYSSTLPEDLPMVLFATCVSLLPGTLSQRFEGRQLLLHVLDRRVPLDAGLRQLEVRIAATFGAREVGHD